jgi:signal recognition particle receptor subunit beta
MAEISADQHEINARIVYWGIPGAGVSTNLRTIHARLKASNRGELREIATRIDPTVSYEILPIELGEVNGIRTHLHVVAAPGAPEQAPTRKQLVDRIDGLVLVIDSRPNQIEANLKSVAELRDVFAAYGRNLADLPVIVQYNKRDLSDPATIDELHRRLELPEAAVYEAVASDATGVLKTLTTISKSVVRALRRDPIPTAPTPAAVAEPAATAPPLPEPVPVYDPEALARRAEPATEETLVTSTNVLEQVFAAPKAPPSPRMDATSLMEQAILAEAENEHEADAAAEAAFDAQRTLDRPWEQLASEAKPSAGARIGADLKIVSVGSATRSGERGVRVPLVLGNDDGETVTLALTLQLDPLLDDES